MAPSRIIYGPVTQSDGYRVTRIRRPDGSTFTVRVPTNRCERGHLFTEDNSYVIPSTGRRTCRVCRRAREAGRPQLHALEDPWITEDDPLSVAAVNRLWADVMEVL
jgi:hypothetical protein